MFLFYFHKPAFHIPRSLIVTVLAFGLALFGAVVSCHAMGMAMNHGANDFLLTDASSVAQWLHAPQPCCRIVSPGMQATLSSRAAVKESAAGMMSLLLAGAALIAFWRYRHALLLMRINGSPVISRDPSPPRFLQEAFSRGILNPKIF